MPTRSAALHGGTLLQASLEIYSPLDHVELRAGADVANLAQSMTAATVQIGGRLIEYRVIEQSTEPIDQP